MRYITSVTVTLIATVWMNLLNQTNCQTDTANLPALSRKLRYALFPGASTMGLYLAVAIPLEDSRYDLSVSWNFEANYHLPSNYTELALPFIVSTAARSERHVTRRHTYQVIQDRLNSYGLDGRECLLKTICETADTSLNHNGVIGDVLQIIFTLILETLTFVHVTQCWHKEGYTTLSLPRNKRSLVFPDGSVIGMILAASIPLELRGDISLAWFIEADYHLPENATDFLPIIDHEESRTSRNLLNRRRVYDMLQLLFVRLGVNGKECLLKTICEIGRDDLHENEYNGLLGEILRIVFTPSSSANEGLDPVFLIAEQHGSIKDNCDRLYPDCPRSPLEYFTQHKI